MSFHIKIIARTHTRLHPINHKISFPCACGLSELNNQPNIHASCVVSSVDQSVHGWFPSAWPADPCHHCDHCHPCADHAPSAHCWSAAPNDHAHCSVCGVTLSWAALWVWSGRVNSNDHGLRRNDLIALVEPNSSKQNALSSPRACAVKSENLYCNDGSLVKRFPIWFLHHTRLVIRQLIL